MISGVVIVAHSNDTIRKGLGAIIRSIAGVRVVEQTTLSVINTSIKDILAYIIEPTMITDFNCIGGVCARSKPKGILVYDAAGFSNESIDLPSIHIGLSADEIVEVVKGAFVKPKNISNTVSEFELSAREIDVLKCVALGMSNKEIADKLFISIHTSITHRKNITAKLGIKSTSGLTIYAIMEGYIEPSTIDIRG